MKEEVEKKEVHPAKFSQQGSDDLIKQLLSSGEHVVYHSDDIYLTNKRIIKRRTTWWARTFHFFYETFEDIDYKFLGSIKAKNIINLKLFSIGLIIILLKPISDFIGAIPGLGFLSSGLLEPIADNLGLGGMILIGLILIVSSLLLRDRVIEFYGSNSVLRARHFFDEELVKVRELQEIRLKK